MILSIFIFPPNFVLETVVAFGFTAKAPEKILGLFGKLGSNEFSNLKSQVGFKKTFSPNNFLDALIHDFKILFLFFTLKNLLPFRNVWKNSQESTLRWWTKIQEKKKDCYVYLDCLYTIIRLKHQNGTLKQTRMSYLQTWQN